MRTTTPIIPLLTPYPRKLSVYLKSKGFLVRPISYPTVEKGKERVRVCLHGGNSEKDVTELGRVLQEWFKSEGGAERERARL